MLVFLNRFVMMAPFQILSSGERKYQSKMDLSHKHLTLDALFIYHKRNNGNYRRSTVFVAFDFSLHTFLTILVQN